MAITIKKRYVAGETRKETDSGYRTITKAKAADAAVSNQVKKRYVAGESGPSTPTPVAPKTATKTPVKKKSLFNKVVDNVAALFGRDLESERNKKAEESKKKAEAYNTEQQAKQEKFNQGIKNTKVGQPVTLKKPQVTGKAAEMTVSDVEKRLASPEEPTTKEGLNAKVNVYKYRQDLDTQIMKVQDRIKYSGTIPFAGDGRMTQTNPALGTAPIQGIGSSGDVTAEDKETLRVLKAQKAIADDFIKRLENPNAYKGFGKLADIFTGGKAGVDKNAKTDNIPYYGQVINWAKESQLQEIQKKIDNQLPLSELEQALHNQDQWDAIDRARNKTFLENLSEVTTGSVIPSIKFRVERMGLELAAGLIAAPVAGTAVAAKTVALPLWRQLAQHVGKVVVREAGMTIANAPAISAETMRLSSPHWEVTGGDNGDLIMNEFLGLPKDAAFFQAAAVAYINNFTESILEFTPADKSAKKELAATMAKQIAIASDAADLLVQDSKNVAIRNSLGSLLAKMGVTKYDDYINFVKKYSQTGVNSVWDFVKENAEEELAEMMSAPVEGRQYNAPWTKEYMNAVASGDKETANKMMQEAAFRWLSTALSISITTGGDQTVNQIGNFITNKTALGQEEIKKTIDYNKKNNITPIDLTPIVDKNKKEDDTTKPPEEPGTPEGGNVVETPPEGVQTPTTSEGVSKTAPKTNATVQGGTLSSSVSDEKLAAMKKDWKQNWSARAAGMTEEQKAVLGQEFIAKWSKEGVKLKPVETKKVEKVKIEAVKPIKVINPSVAKVESVKLDATKIPNESIEVLPTVIKKEAASKQDAELQKYVGQNIKWDGTHTDMKGNKSNFTMDMKVVSIKNGQVQFTEGPNITGGMSIDEFKNRVLPNLVVKKSVLPTTKKIAAEKVEVAKKEAALIEQKPAVRPETPVVQKEKIQGPFKSENTNIDIERSIKGYSNFDSFSEDFKYVADNLSKIQAERDLTSFDFVGMSSVTAEQEAIFDAINREEGVKNIAEADLRKYFDAIKAQQSIDSAERQVAQVQVQQEQETENLKGLTIVAGKKFNNEELPPYYRTGRDEKKVTKKMGGVLYKLLLKNGYLNTTGKVKAIIKFLDTGVYDEKLLTNTKPVFYMLRNQAWGKLAGTPKYSVETFNTLVGSVLAEKPDNTIGKTRYQLIEDAADSIQKYGPITKKQATKIVRRFFKKDEVMVKFVTRLMDNKNFPAFGSYLNRMITFIENPNESTPYHEAVHAFMDMVLPADVKERIIEYATVRFGIADSYAVEEKIADEFIKYVKTQEAQREKSFLTRIFDSIVKFIKKLQGKTDLIDQMFQDIIDQRRYTQKEMEFGAIAKYQENLKWDETTRTLQFLERNMTELGGDTLTVSKEKVSEVMKTLNATPIDRAIVNLALEQFDDENVNLIELLKRAHREVMPIVPIETTQYAEYSLHGLRREENAVRAKTLVYDTAFAHGEYGANQEAPNVPGHPHWEDAYNALEENETMEIVEEPREGKGSNWAVYRNSKVEQNYSDEIPFAQSFSRRVNVTKTKEEAREFIEYMKTRKHRVGAGSDSSYDRRKGDQVAGLYSGMIGHVRLMIENTIRYLVEIQSDTFQGYSRDLLTNSLYFGGQKVAKDPELKKRIKNITKKFINVGEKTGVAQLIYTGENSVLDIEKVNSGFKIYQELVPPLNTERSRKEREEVDDKRNELINSEYDGTMTREEYRKASSDLNLKRAEIEIQYVKDIAAALSGTDGEYYLKYLLFVHPRLGSDRKVTIKHLKSIDKSDIGISVRQEGSNTGDISITISDVVFTGNLMGALNDGSSHTDLIDTIFGIQGTIIKEIINSEDKAAIEELKNNVSYIKTKRTPNYETEITRMPRKDKDLKLLVANTDNLEDLYRLFYFNSGRDTEQREQIMKRSFDKFLEAPVISEQQKLLEKQFFAYEKGWNTLALQYQLREALLSGQEKMAVPTGATVISAQNYNSGHVLAMKKREYRDYPRATFLPIRESQEETLKGLARDLETVDEKVTDLLGRDSGIGTYTHEEIMDKFYNAIQLINADTTDDYVKHILVNTNVRDYAFKDKYRPRTDVSEDLLRELGHAVPGVDILDVGQDFGLYSDDDVRSRVIQTALLKGKYKVKSSYLEEGAGLENKKLNDVLSVYKFRRAKPGAMPELYTVGTNYNSETVHMIPMVLQYVVTDSEGNDYAVFIKNMKLQYASEADIKKAIESDPSKYIEIPVETYGDLNYGSRMRYAKNKREIGPANLKFYDQIQQFREALVKASNGDQDAAREVFDTYFKDNIEKTMIGNMVKIRDHIIKTGDDVKLNSEGSYDTTADKEEWTNQALNGLSLGDRQKYQALLKEVADAQSYRDTEKIKQIEERIQETQKYIKLDSEYRYAVEKLDKQAIEKKLTIINNIPADKRGAVLEKFNNEVEAVRKNWSMEKLSQIEAELKANRDKIITTGQSQQLNQDLQNARLNPDEARLKLARKKLEDFLNGKSEPGETERPDVSARMSIKVQKSHVTVVNYYEQQVIPEFRDFMKKRGVEVYLWTDEKGFQWWVADIKGMQPEQVIRYQSSNGSMGNVVSQKDLEDSADKGRDIWAEKTGIYEGKDIISEKKSNAHQLGLSLNKSEPNQLIMALLGGTAKVSTDLQTVKSLVGKRITSMENIVDEFSYLRGHISEIAHYIIVDKDGKVLTHKAVTYNLPDAVSFNRMGLIYDMTRLNGAGYYLVHNHPAGFTDPSPADKEITLSASLRLGKEKFLGHVILDTTEYTKLQIGESGTQLKRPVTRQIKNAPVDMRFMPGRITGGMSAQIVINSMEQEAVKSSPSLTKSGKYAFVIGVTPRLTVFRKGIMIKLTGKTPGENTEIVNREIAKAKKVQGWLTALVYTPSFKNLSTQRHLHSLDLFDTDGQVPQSNIVTKDPNMHSKMQSDTHKAEAVVLLEKTSMDYFRDEQDSDFMPDNVRELFASLERKKVKTGKVYEASEVPVLPSSKIQLDVEQSVEGKSTPASRAATAFVPVIETTGKIRKSRAFQRIKEQYFDLVDEGFDIPDYGYKQMKLAETIAKGIAMAEKYPKISEEIALGLQQPPEGTTNIAVSLAIGNKLWAKKEYDRATAVWAAMSFRLTRFGQEVVSVRGALNVDSPMYFVNQIIQAKKQVVTREYRKRQGFYARAKQVVTNGKNNDFDKIKKEKVDEIKESLKNSKIQYAQEFIDSLICR